MDRKWLTVILMAALLVALVSILWAATQTEKMQGEVRERMRQMGTTPTMAKEFDRCTKTCNMVMPHYRQKYTAQKTHEGDRACWQTCWSRFGDKSVKSPSATQTKALWMIRRPQYMRVNQCGQACWRRFHQGQAAITVAGYRSEPRPWAPGGMAMMAR
jgi:hypothetical protein